MATREQLDHLRQRIRHTARLIYRDLGRDAGPAEQRTVRAMDDDGIHWTRPDGSEGRTAWPLPWECSIIGETLTFYVPGSDVARALRMCPDSSTATDDEHLVVLDVEHLGRIEVRCRLLRLKRGRRRQEFWVAEHARRIGLPESHRV